MGQEYSILKDGKVVAMASDHAGYELKCIIEGYLEECPLPNHFRENWKIWEEV